MRTDGKIVNNNFNISSKIEDKKKVYIIHILDRSGSMAGQKLFSAIEGINYEIKTLQQDSNVEYIVSLIFFDDKKQIIYWLKPIKEVTDKVNTWDGSATALFQTLGEILEQGLKDIPLGENVLVSIFTDGGENASKGKYANSNVLKELIEEVKKKSYTITFIGTQIDVQAIIRNLNIDASNTLVHNNTAVDITRTATIRTQSTLNYSKKVARGMSGESIQHDFYSEEK